MMKSCILAVLCTFYLKLHDRLIQNVIFTQLKVNSDSTIDKRNAINQWKAMAIAMIGVHAWVKERKGWWLSGSRISSLLDCTVITTHTLWRNTLPHHPHHPSSVMSILRQFSARLRSRRSRRARLRQRPTWSESEERSRSCLQFSTQTSFTSTRVSKYNCEE